MEGYIGEEIVNVHENEDFKNFTKEDWVMLYIEQYGYIDGSHHKQWLLDQIARIIKGVEVIVTKATWENGHSEYRYNLSDVKTKEYSDWVLEMMGDYDEDADEYEYSYDEGISP
jgi:hypothetical protein